MQAIELGTFQIDSMLASLEQALLASSTAEPLIPPLLSTIVPDSAGDC